MSLLKWWIDFRIKLLLLFYWCLFPHISHRWWRWWWRRYFPELVSWFLSPGLSSKQFEHSRSHIVIITSRSVYNSSWKRQRFSTFSKVCTPTHSRVNQPVVMSRRTLTPPPQVRLVMTARFFIVWKEQHGISQEAANKGLNIVLLSWRVLLPCRQDAKRGVGRCKTEVGDRLGLATQWAEPVVRVKLLPPARVVSRATLTAR